MSIFINGLGNVEATEYLFNQPFPSGVLDNFVDPKLLKSVLDEFPSLENPVWSYKACETSIKYHLSDYDAFGYYTKQVFDALKDRPFIEELERVTGIKDLHPDDGLEGGGLHMIPTGGFLKLHADFNWSRKLKMMRKVNILIYLNEDWEDEMDGALELVGGKTRVIVPPLFNRMAFFSTSSETFHGHPYPLKSLKPRKSLAAYYYTKEPEPEVKHSTVYRTDLENKLFENTLIV